MKDSVSGRLGVSSPRSVIEVSATTTEGGSVVLKVSTPRQ